MEHESAYAEQAERIILGAEARVTITPTRVIKERIPKAYRHPLLDTRLREERAKREERITLRANQLGICATSVKREGTTLIFTRLNGKSVAELEQLPHTLPTWLARALFILHSHGIIHGDITPRNILIVGGSFTLIDYGLSFFSHRWEDRAYDISMIRHTFAHHPGFYKAVRDAYASHLSAEEEKRFTERLAAILQRGRHKRKQND